MILIEAPKSSTVGARYIVPAMIFMPSMINVAYTMNARDNSLRSMHIIAINDYRSGHNILCSYIVVRRCDQ